MEHCLNFLIFSLLKAFFYFFVLLYKMVDSECNMDINKSVTVMKNLQMLKFVTIRNNICS